MGKYDYELDLNNKKSVDYTVVNTVKPNSTVLELGPADGRLTKYMKESLNCKVYIVEYTKEDYEIAIKYAEDGIQGDILEFKWLEKFKDVKFDYILFTDVLEHLYSPEKALEASITLLKNNGSVLISVPNIAHNSIIIDLLDNNFEYKETGLLDKTHIHFFTYNSLVKMISDCNLVPIVTSSVDLHSLNTEFINDKHNLGEDKYFDKKYGTVYQFVFICVKQPYYLENQDQIKIINNIEQDDVPIKSSMYFDNGKGFLEKEKIFFEVFKQTETTIFESEINIPENVSEVRFDPVENCYCVLKNLKIYADGIPYGYESTNGFKIDNCDFFLTKDPQVKIKLNGKIKTIKLSFEIRTYDLDNYIIDILEDSFRLDLATKLQLKAMDKQLVQLNSNIAQQNDKITQLNSQLEQSQLQIEDLAFHYNAIQNSTFWRMTKPARFIIGGIKTFFRNNKFTRLPYKTIVICRHHGIKFTYNKFKEYKHIKKYGPPPVPEMIKKKAQGFANKYNQYILENDILSENAKLFPPPDKMIDILIPVYNGYGYLEKLFETINKTKAKFRLIIIDDNSPDDRVYPFLEEKVKIYTDAVLIKNDENLGFVQTVNKMLSLSENDVVILNTDVELPEFWLERLMLPITQNSKIASATPFTNAGTICSFPNIVDDNDIYEGLSVDALNKGFMKIKPTNIEMPTGVGFCMAMSKDAIDDVGFLDAEAFSKGYGEENDWCQRAIKVGYKNVMVENLFVYHKHGGSFTSEEKQKLIAHNINIINERYPHYNMQVAEYIEDDPHYYLRNLLSIMAHCELDESAPVKLIFNHNIGGGADDYLNKKIKEYLIQNNRCIVVKYDINDKNYILQYYYKEYSYEFLISKIEHLFNLLNITGVTEIIINELVTYPDIAEVLDLIIKIKSKFNAKLIKLMHDFYSLCPSYTLINNEGNFCGIPKDMKICNNCLTQLQETKGFTTTDLSQWRNEWAKIFTNADEVIAFSHSTAELLTSAYGKLDNLKVLPHVVDYVLPVSKNKKTTKSFNIGVLGAIGTEKGANIIHEMLKIIENEKLNINIVIIGYTLDSIKSKNLITTGKYDKQDIPKLSIKHDVDVFFIPSIWPETFSYTTEEVMKMDFPLACFNLGAPAERVLKYEKGLVINQINAKSALNEIRNKFSKF